MRIRRKEKKTEYQKTDSFSSSAVVAGDARTFDKEKDIIKRSRTEVLKAKAYDTDLPLEEGNREGELSVDPDNKSLYILLSRTQTIPSRVIRFLSPMPYVHASIAFDENLDEMYSFARKRVHYPFYCGLIDEDINKGIFARKKHTECLVLRLPVTEEEYDKAHDSVEHFKAHRRRYGYNYLGVFAVKFHKAIERKYDYFCSQFVDKVLQMSGINLFGKTPGLVTPEDYRNSDKLEHFYEGLLTNYRGWLSSFDMSKDEKARWRQDKKELREHRRSEKVQRRELRQEQRQELKELRQGQRQELRELRQGQRQELKDQREEKRMEFQEQLQGFRQKWSGTTEQLTSDQEQDCLLQ